MKYVHFHGMMPQGVELEVRKPLYVAYKKPGSGWADSGAWL
jgi:hypothetical protein